MNEDDKRNEIDDMTGLLLRLRPARGELDSRVVFYEAGFSAAQSNLAPPRRPKLALVTAAGLLVALVTAPASYRIGQTAALRDATQAKPSHQPERPAANVSDADWPANVDPPVGEEGTTEAAPPRAVERASEPSLFARWIDPSGPFAGSAKFGSSTQTTLTAFYGAAIPFENAGRDRIHFPVASTSAKYRQPSVASSGDDSSSVPPLMVGDFGAVTQSLEATR